MKLPVASYNSSVTLSGVEGCFQGCWISGLPDYWMSGNPKISKSSSMNGTQKAAVGNRRSQAPRYDRAAAVNAPTVGLWFES